MSAPYFDATSASDKNLLPQGARSNPELGNVAALAEAAVIGYYTVNPPYYLYTSFLQYVSPGNRIGPSTSLGLLLYVERGLGEDISSQGLPATASPAQLRVYLRGFKADAADPNVDPNLKTALKKTIAMVTRWWLQGWGKQPAIASSSDFQAKARSYRANADDAFPPDWNLLLIPFDSKPMPWGL